MFGTKRRKTVSSVDKGVRNTPAIAPLITPVMSTLVRIQVPGVIMCERIAGLLAVVRWFT